MEPIDPEGETRKIDRERLKVEVENSKTNKGLRTIAIISLVVNAGLVIYSSESITTITEKKQYINEQEEWIHELTDSTQKAAGIIRHLVRTKDSLTFKLNSISRNPSSDVIYYETWWYPSSPGVGHPFFIENVGLEPAMNVKVSLEYYETKENQVGIIIEEYFDTIFISNYNNITQLDLVLDHDLQPGETVNIEFNIVHEHDLLAKNRSLNLPKIKVSYNLGRARRVYVNQDKY